MDSIQLYEAVRRIQPSASHAMMALAQELGIHVEFADDYKNLLGMYFNRWHHRFIFLNSRLDEDWLPMVLAHEIGHDQLHRELAKTGLQEFELFRMSSRTEYEANAFAAHLLLDNDEVYRLVRARIWRQSRSACAATSTSCSSRCARWSRSATTCG